MSNPSDEALLKQVYQDAHYAADLTNKCYDANGHPLAMPFCDAQKLLQRIRMNLETALGAVKDLEARAVERQKEK